MTHIAVVEDEPLVRALLVRTLGYAGYRVSEFARGGRVVDVLSEDVPALAIVDLGLPDVDGLTLVQRIREKFSSGVVIVSGMGEVTDRVLGLEVGADAYLPKPFVPGELLATVRSVLRRTMKSPSAGKPPVEFEGFVLDVGAEALFDAKGNSVEVTPSALRVLYAFVTHPNQILTRDQLVHLGYDSQKPATNRAVDIQVARLRALLVKHGLPANRIQTVRNRGYVFSS